MTVPALSRSAKGALVRVTGSPGMRALCFQYNPETLRRTFEPQMLGGSNEARAQTVRYAAAATQTISVECHFSVEHPAGMTALAGQVDVTPQLAALELMAYPSLGDVASAQSALDLGAIEVVPPAADPLLFVWGRQTSLPVQLTSVAVLEEVFDAELRPVRATVSLAMRVLTYSDVDPDAFAYGRFTTWQAGMEKLADGAFTSYAG